MKVPLQGSPSPQSPPPKPSSPKSPQTPSDPPTPPSPPIPAPPPYVLSWLKLAKSRWPLPASPLCPAKFMAGQPSTTPVRRGDASKRQRNSSPAAPARSTRPRPPHRRQRLVYAAGGTEAPRRRCPAPAPWLRMRSSAPPALAVTVPPPRMRRLPEWEEPRMRYGGGAEHGWAKGGEMGVL